MGASRMVSQEMYSIWEFPKSWTTRFNNKGHFSRRIIEFNYSKQTRDCLVFSCTRISEGEYLCITFNWTCNQSDQEVTRWNLSDEGSCDRQFTPGWRCTRGRRLIWNRSLVLTSRLIIYNTLCLLSGFIGYIENGWNDECWWRWYDALEFQKIWRKAYECVKMDWLVEI